MPVNRSHFGLPGANPAAVDATPISGSPTLKKYAFPSYQGM